MIAHRTFLKKPPHVLILILALTLILPASSQPAQNPLLLDSVADCDNFHPLCRLSVKAVLRDQLTPPGARIDF